MAWLIQTPAQTAGQAPYASHGSVFGQLYTSWNGIIRDVSLPQHPLQLLDQATQKKAGITIHNPNHPPDYLSYSSLKTKSLCLNIPVLANKKTAIFQISDPLMHIIGFWNCVHRGIRPLLIDPAQTDYDRKLVSHYVSTLPDTVVISDSDFDIKAEPINLPPVPQSLDTPLYYQSSSGTTGTPKAVPITARMLATAIDDIADRILVQSSDIVFNWLSLNHDMGWVGFHLFPLYKGLDQHHILPQTFIRHPSFWLAYLSKTRATLVSCPPFGLNWIVKTIKSTATLNLDLSAIRLLFNGAERVIPQESEAFCDLLAPHGFSAKALYPVYGLAEATLAVSMPEPGIGLETVWVAGDSLKIGQKIIATEAATSGATAFAKLGQPLSHITLSIWSDDNTPLPKNTLGHIMISGPAVAPDSDSTNASMIDTQDLGWIDDQEQLVVIGRSSEWISQHGRAWFAPIIENNVADQFRVSPVVLRQSSPDNHLILAIKRSSGANPNLQKMSRYLADTFGLEIHDVQYVSNWPRTRTGKLKRHALKKIQSLKSSIRSCFEAVLKHSDFSNQDSFFDCGGTSLKGVALVNLLNTELGLAFSLTDLAECPSVDAIYEVITS